MAKAASAEQIVAELAAEEAFEERMYQLRLHNPQAKNDPNNPYRGVAALFNGDLHLADPNFAPREHWEVISPYVIRHYPVDEILARQEETRDAE